MAGTDDGDEVTLLRQADGADRDAFDRLAEDNLPKLRGLVRRMVGHPDETDDVVQESLVRAWQARDTFRGDSKFGTWLCAIGARAALDHLRQAKRWRPRAQIAYSNECYREPELGMEVGSTLASPDFTYDVREHIAFCFACVGRSLGPEEQAALLLTEVFDMKGRDAAKALGLSESVYRHALAAARERMTATYDDLCVLVNKKGVCYQCSGLREGTREAGRGDGPPHLEPLAARIDVVRGADIDSGVSQRLHDLFWRRISEIETKADDSEAVEPYCPT